MSNVERRTVVAGHHVDVVLEPVSEALTGKLLSKNQPAFSCIHWLNTEGAVSSKIECKAFKEVAGSRENLGTVNFKPSTHSLRIVNLEVSHLPHLQSFTNTDGVKISFYL